MSSTTLPTPPAEFQGWIGKDKNSVGNLEHGSYTPKPFEETDVDIAISHCGICASDLHTLRSGWFPSLYPQVVGHEIVGIAVRVGKDVKHIKVGDRVGVGAQSGSCRECEECQAEREPYCHKGQIGTYNGKYSDGSKSSGGYADFSRVPAHFAIKVPEGLPSAVAAPMMCGGVTVYSPLRQYGAGTERKRVGVIGIGGLGHFGLLFAKALGAEVTAISHSASKKKDAEAMGATHFIATADGDHVFDDNAGKLDLIICTTNNHDMPLTGYLKLLSRHGYFVFVGAPEEPIPQFQVFPLLMTNVHITGSAIGSPAVIQEMLELAAKQNVKAWIEERPLEKVNEALIDMENSKARYRYVLVNSAHKHLVKE